MNIHNNFLAKTLFLLIVISCCSLQNVFCAQDIYNYHINFNSAKLDDILNDRFSRDLVKREASSKKLLNTKISDANKALVWQQYKNSHEHDMLREEWKQKIVKTDIRTSPYLWRYVGAKPKDGWGLAIAMHGGGGAPKELNDSQWKGMFTSYYKDHPENGGYIYLALRAPNDEWNGFYDDAICPLVERLIKQFVLFAEVDPNKVYTLGASHGGYGAFVIGPKIPYRFAAVHAAASAPSDGETMGENLRDLPFTIMTGALDNDYGRIDRCRKFMTQIADWRKLYGGYDVILSAPEGVGHHVPDHDILADMLKIKRNIWQKHIVWTQSDNVLHHFYWIESLFPVDGGKVIVNVDGNVINIHTLKQDKIVLWLDNDLVNLHKSVKVIFNGIARDYKVKPSLENYCSSLIENGDPNMAGSVRIEVQTPP